MQPTRYYINMIQYICTTTLQMFRLHKIMNRLVIFITFYFYYGIVTSGNISSEIILAVMKEFQINQPVIMNSLLDHKDLTNIIKSLSHQEYSMSFRQSQINSYKSCIIFTDLLSDFKWNLTTTYSPTLVVSEIKRNTVGPRMVLSIFGLDLCKIYTM